MQVGPITLLKTKTFSQVLSQRTFLFEENSRLANELGVGGTTHSFMHYPWNATTASKTILEPDEANAKHNEAVSRVIKAYQKADKERIEAAPGMWHEIEAKNKHFVGALQSGNQAVASEVLSKLFQSQAIWGLGKFDENLLNDMKDPHEKSHLQLRITDALVSLAKGIGAQRLTSVEQQGIEPHLKALTVDLNNLTDSVEKELGFEVGSPCVGGAYGCSIGGRFITLDGLINAYIAYRLHQLGATKGKTVVEIGGGFGCLAEIVFRAFDCNYAIYDLPWVAAIQGYFLIMSLPSGSVKLLGEEEGRVEVLPFWRFNSLQDRSLDFVINSDSLPEMGYETAVSYIEKIAKALKGVFLSINQEAMSKNSNAGKQNCVHSIANAVGGMKLISRSIYWMRQGFVEEVFSPIVSS